MRCDDNPEIIWAAGHRTRRSATRFALVRLYVPGRGVPFAASEPLGRDVVGRVVDRDCALDRLNENISAKLAGRLDEIARVAGGRQFRTRPHPSVAIRVARQEGDTPCDLTPNEALVLIIVACNSRGSAPADHGHTCLKRKDEGHGPDPEGQAGSAGTCPSHGP